MALRVVVAEDNLLVREGIIKLLEHQDGHRGRAARAAPTTSSWRRRARAARRRAHRHPHAARPGPTKASAPRSRCASRIPASASWCSASTSDPAYALALLERGSEGRAYLLKERVSDAAQIVHAIEEVARGGSVIDPMVVEALVAPRPRAGVAARPADAARARGARADGPGPEQRRHRAGAVPLRTGGREAHQLAVLQARAHRGARRPPPGEGRAAVPRREQGG